MKIIEKVLSSLQYFILNHTEFQLRRYINGLYRAIESFVDTGDRERERESIFTRKRNLKMTSALFGSFY